MFRHEHIDDFQHNLTWRNFNVMRAHTSFAGREHQPPEAHCFSMVVISLALWQFYMPCFVWLSCPQVQTKVQMKVLKIKEKLVWNPSWLISSARQQWLDPHLHQWRVKPWCFGVPSANAQLWERASGTPKMSGWPQLFDVWPYGPGCTVSSCCLWVDGKMQVEYKQWTRSCKINSAMEVL